MAEGIGVENPNYTSLDKSSMEEPKDSPPDYYMSIRNPPAYSNQNGVNIMSRNSTVEGVYQDVNDTRTLRLPNGSMNTVVWYQQKDFRKTVLLGLVCFCFGILLATIITISASKCDSCDKKQCPRDGEHTTDMHTGNTDGHKPFNPDGLVELSTKDEYIYKDSGHQYDQVMHVIFDVQACNDAHVALSTTRGNYDTNTYEIVIGGWANTRSAIRKEKQGHRFGDCATEFIVSCTEYRRFWVSWGHGIVSVGTGDKVGTGTFCAYSDPQPYDVNYVAVSTGWGASGKWIIYAPEESPKDDPIPDIPPDTIGTDQCIKDDHCKDFSDYEIIFRSTSGSGVNLYETWINDGGYNTNKDRLVTSNSKPKGPYKSDRIDTEWNSIKKIRMSVYKDGIEVMYMLFDTEGTTKINWFSQANVICSSYLDLTTSPTNYFSLDGHWRDSAGGHSRRFYVWSRYGGCPNDLGWFMVTDNDHYDHGGGVCNFEQNLSGLPTFVYSRLNVRGSHLDLEEGDVFVIRALFA